MDNKRVVYLFAPDIKCKYSILLNKIQKFYTPFNRLIHFVPTLYKKIFLEEKIKEFFPEKDYIFLPEIHTPSTFCEKFLLPLTDKKIISDAQGYILFYFLLKQRKDLLKVFYKTDSGITGLEGFSKKLFETYKLVRNYVPFEKFDKILYRNEINDFLSRYPLVYEKIEFSFKFFDSFETFLAENGLILKSLFIKDTLKYLKNFNFNYLIIDSFLDFTEMEKVFFKELILKAEKTVATFENYRGRKIDEILNKTLEFYRENDFEFVEVDSGERRKKDVKIFKFSSRDEEVEEICRKIIYEVSKNKKRFSDFIISFPNLKNYTPHIQRVFYIYGVPYYLNVKENILNFPESKILFSLIDVYIRRFSYHSFINFITSPLLRKVSAQFKNILPKYARMVNVLVGRNYWVKMKEVIEELREERSYAKQIEDEDVKLIEENIAYIFDILRDLNPNEKKEIREWISWLKDILEKLGYFEEINDIKLTLWNKLNQISRISLFPLKLSLYELKNVLWKYLEDEGISRVLREKEGVKIIGLFELTGVENEVLIFGGVNDGEFPRIIESDLLLPDRVKKMLGMPTRKDIIKRDELNFEKIKNNFDEIILTFPLEEDERVLLPSPLIEDEENVRYGFKETQNLLIGDIEVQMEIGKRMKFSISENFEIEPIFSEKEFKQVIEKIFPGKEIYVIEIVNYGRCPYKFYLESIIGCEKIEEPVPTVKGIIIGRIFHKVMESLMKEFKQINYNFEMFESIYDMVVKNVVTNFRIPDAFKVYLKHYLKYHEALIKEKEIERKDRGFVPLYLEKSVRKKDNGFTIFGRIDRIDYSPKEKVYEIVDYKTGGRRMSLKNPIDALQLYLYIHLSKDLLGKDKNYRVLIYTFDREEDKSYEVSRKEYVELIKEILGGISKGQFPAKPYRKSECKKCIFKNFCSLWIREK